MQTSLFKGDHPVRIDKRDRTEEDPETRDPGLGRKMILGILTVVLQETETDIIIIGEKFPRLLQHMELTTEI